VLTNENVCETFRYEPTDRRKEDQLFY